MFSVLKEVDAEALRHLYWDEEKSLGEIALGNEAASRAVAI